MSPLEKLRQFPKLFTRYGSVSEKTEIAILRNLFSYY